MSCNMNVVYFLQLLIRLNYRFIFCVITAEVLPILFSFQLLKQKLPHDARTHDARTDGDISLILELPENDKFFKKKKV